MNIRKLSVLLPALFLIFFFAGCSAGNNATKSENYVDDQGFGYYNRTEAVGDVSLEEKPADTPAEDDAIQPELPDNRKLIQTVRMTVEVQELTGSVMEIENHIADHGGYVEASDIYNGSSYNGSRSRYASMTVRIPADRLESFLSMLSGLSNVVSSNKAVEDVTLSYVSTESRLTALRTEETRLLELLSKAETMEDLLTVESRLTTVRTELEKVASTLRVYDNQVDYATVRLSISEVKIYTDTKEPETVGERISKDFSDSIRNIWNSMVELFIWFVGNIIYILLFASATAVIVILVRRQRKKKKAEKRASAE